MMLDPHARSVAASAVIAVSTLAVLAMVGALRWLRNAARVEAVDRELRERFGDLDTKEPS